LRPYDTQGVEPGKKKKFIWMGPRGILDAFKISDVAYEDKPMDLSNYMLLRTKEKMLLEAKLKDPELVRRSKGMGARFDKWLNEEPSPEAGL